MASKIKWDQKGKKVKSRSFRKILGELVPEKGGWVSKNAANNGSQPIEEGVDRLHQHLVDHSGRVSAGAGGHRPGRPGRQDRARPRAAGDGGRAIREWRAGVGLGEDRDPALRAGRLGRSHHPWRRHAQEFHRAHGLALDARVPGLRSRACTSGDQRPGARALRQPRPGDPSGAERRASHGRRR